MRGDRYTDNYTKTDIEINLPPAHFTQSTTQITK